MGYAQKIVFFEEKKAYYEILKKLSLLFQTVQDYHQLVDKCFDEHHLLVRTFKCPKFTLNIFHSFDLNAVFL